MRVLGVAVVGGGRRGHRTLVRTLTFVFLATFLWLQLHVASLTNPYDISTSENESHRLPNDGQNSTNGSNSTAGTLGNLTISDIRRHIEKFNLEQRVFNEETFGPLPPDAPVIMIQVHTRLTYLRHLIVSLAQAKGIEQTLLVFSHDVWDPDINYLVQSVDFCRVMQIFYPYSIQTHPHTFPGEDINDCPRDINKESALVKNCINAEHPDLYGHYREAKFTQTKHHWWWKANRVFDQLTVTKNHVGMVLFLEEDHYVAEDFLHVLGLMESTSAHSCERCNILSLGTYLKAYNYRKINGKAEIIPWISSKHNMGMAFNRVTWNKIKNCADKFCSYDDYNWDWSLQHIAQECIPSTNRSIEVPLMKSGLTAMVMKAPRVFHIGECGVHHKKADCESTSVRVVAKVQKALETARKYLFPSELTLTNGDVGKKANSRKSYGGWGDIRDHQLCMNITMNPELRLP